MRTRRLFAGVAAEASETLLRTLSDMQEALRGEHIRWVRPENLHLTVDFFGETPDERIPALEEALARAARRTPPFAMAIGGLGTFGGPRHPRVLWAGIESAGLARLHGCVAEELRAAGREPDARAFAPHLTLARIGGLKDARRFGEAVRRFAGWTGPAIAVRELVLFESLRDDRGTVYAKAGRWPLAGDPAAGGPEDVFRED